MKNIIKIMPDGRVISNEELEVRSAKDRLYSELRIAVAKFLPDGERQGDDLLLLMQEERAHNLHYW